MELNKQIKIIFFDVDYTAYDHTHKMIRPLTMYALRKLKEKGIKIVISTSRNMDELKDVNPEFLKLADTISSLAGARTIYQDRIDNHIIDKKDIEKLIKYFKDKNITYRYACDNGVGYLSSDESYVVDLFLKYFYMVPEIKEYEYENILQIMYYTFDDNVHKEIKELVPGLVVNNMKLNNEISSNNIDKGNVMKDICAYYNLSLDNTMAFGDSENDITMLDNAYFGVCMDNGGKTTKSHADYICEDMTNDGIYKTLVKYDFIEPYIEKDRQVFDDIILGMKKYQEDKNTINKIATLFKETIINGGVVQMLGIDKLGCLPQELYYRSGGLVPFHKMELYKNDDINTLLNRYELDDKDMYLIIAEDGNNKLLKELCHYIKNNKQKLVLLLRNNDCEIIKYADYFYKLKENDNKLNNTIDDTFAQMLSFETYRLLKLDNIEPLIFMSNNNPDASKHNKEVLSKYGLRVHE